jgi:hypothetical protein
VNSDDLKQAWQSQPRPAIDAEWLLAEVRRNRRTLTAAVFWRDVREVGLSLLMSPLWVYLGVTLALPWSWYLMVPGLLWVAGFMLADRIRHPRRPPDPGEPLVRCVESSLAEVEHQIWLLGNIGWWYLLPLAAPGLVFFGHVGWLSRAAGWPAALVMAGLAAVAGLIVAAVYRLNRACVRRTLEPRRRELRALLAGLQESSADAAESRP